MQQLLFEETQCSTYGPTCFDYKVNDKESKAEAYVKTGSVCQGLRLSHVRDYRDKFILRSLQAEARKENPGFVWFIDGRERAKLIWSFEDGHRMPVGYYIYVEPRSDFSRYANGIVQFPKTLSQIFVQENVRRQGVATRMVRDFIVHAPPGPIWVESPKRETVALLTKLGYCEPKQKYELWQMMEGLSRWVKGEDLLLQRAIMQLQGTDNWVWSGDAPVGISALR